MLLHPHLLYVPRPLWLRLGEAAAERALSIAAALRKAVERWKASVQRSRERAALRHLSPQMLRDIGAADDLLAAALERDSTRASLAEPWRHGL